MFRITDIEQGEDIRTYTVAGEINGHPATFVIDANAPEGHEYLDEPVNLDGTFIGFEYVADDNDDIDGYYLGETRVGSTDDFEDATAEARLCVENVEHEISCAVADIVRNAIVG